MATIKVVNPVGEDNSKFSRLAPVVNSVEGKTAGFRIQWDSFEVFMDRVGEILKERYHPKAILILDKTSKAPRRMELRDRAAADRELAEWAKQIDYAVLGAAA